jgi:hypothetical protein
MRRPKAALCGSSVGTKSFQDDQKATAITLNENCSYYEAELEQFVKYDLLSP